MIILEFVRAIKPPHIVLVHGEANEMGRLVFVFFIRKFLISSFRLKQALENEYEDDNETDITFHMPKNTEKVRFYFRGEKNAKVVGQLAHSQAKG